MENALLEINPFGGQRNRKDFLGGFVARGPAWLCATPVAHGAEGPVLHLPPSWNSAGLHAKVGARSIVYQIQEFITPYP
jgi:hypothetical protein